MSDSQTTQSEAAELLKQIGNQLDCDGDWRDEKDAIDLLKESLQAAEQRGFERAKEMAIKEIGLYFERSIRSMTDKGM